MKKDKFALAIVAGALGVAASALPASAVTIGNMGGGNCYPFTCNDSRTSVGQSMDYQEIYLGSAVGPITISRISFQSYPLGTPELLGGTYDITFGTTTSTLGTGYPVPVSNGETFREVTVSSAQSIGNYLSFSGTPYTFDPLTEGNLVMEVVVTNQDNVCNGCGNGYLWADYTGSLITRAYEIGGQGPAPYTTGALVTSFNGVPEPPAWAMMMLGFAGLGFAGYRASRRSAAFAF